MTSNIINLQNTPDPDTVTREEVTFDSDGVRLVGVLFKPKDASEPLPAAVVTGAWTTVKEQMAGTYARELAARGFAALAFDLSGWGQSEGEPRFVEDHARKTADIKAATAFLKGRSDIDADRISGLGVCASSGYMAEAVADDPALQRLALVAPWLHNPEMAEAIYGGHETAQSLIAQGRKAADASEPQIVEAASRTDDTVPMYQAPYYTEPDRGLIDAYDNKFNLAGWVPWLTYDAQASADRLDKPVLMVGSPSIALPAGAAAYEERMTAPLERVWLGEDVVQFDFYDRPDVVTAAADAVAKHFS
ncbi:CocE/NonD family hydrolase [uncultured Roseobacter sp.]|uniref:alpha/beta hydrolase n=1 Tax=uncultured Roseobacter sp. TaxID=114847 RepID=UPI00260F77A0|nr:CocE/NonD family hydrolase [uncultured Roseobacter sp.]